MRGKIAVTMLFVWMNVYSSISFAADDIQKTIDSIAVPQSPAFSVLGVTPEKVNTPGSFRELALGVLQGIDENGNFQSGLAMDINPYMLSQGAALTLNEYNKFNWLQRAGAQLHISIGVAKGSSETDKSAKTAFGIHVPLINDGDPRKDEKLGSCITTKTQVIMHDPRFKPLPTDDVETVNNKLKGRDEETVKEIKVCRDDHAKRSYSSQALDFGLSPLWTSQDGQTKNFDWGGMNFWTSYKNGISDKLIVILNARYKLKNLDLVSGQAGQVIKGDTVTTGLKFRYGDPAHGVLAQGVYSYYSPEGKKHENQFLYSLGGELKLAENLWLELSLGGTSGKEANNSGFVTSQFKWAFAESSALK